MTREVMLDLSLFVIRDNLFQADVSLEHQGIGMNSYSYYKNI